MDRISTETKRHVLIFKKSWSTMLRAEIAEIARKGIFCHSMTHFFHGQNQFENTDTIYNMPTVTKTACKTRTHPNIQTLIVYSIMDTLQHLETHGPHHDGQKQHAKQGHTLTPKGSLSTILGTKAACKQDTLQHPKTHVLQHNLQMQHASKTNSNTQTLVVYNLVRVNLTCKYNIAQVSESGN